jgi:glycosyltransferase involved in cell wall biosynthesis
MNARESVSVIVPLRDEEPGLEPFWHRLHRVLEDCGRPYAVVFVDDGSTDGTGEALAELAQQSPAVRIITLSRNFGHQAALLAALEHASGDCVVAMDGDLQHPPELIPRLLERWQDGCDLVLTKRIDAPQTPGMKRFSSGVFYRVFRFLSGLELEPGMADFWLIDRRVVEAISSLGERALFLRGLLQWVGFRRETLQYQAENRAAGDSKYSISRMGGLALKGITSFSLVPLRIATALGFLFSGLSFLYLIFAIASAFFTDWNLPGWTSVIGSVLFLGGVQLICLGIIGEYVGQIFLEVKHRPRYIIERLLGFEHE